MSAPDKPIDGRGQLEGNFQTETPGSCEPANPLKAKISVFSNHRERIPSKATCILRFALDTRYGKYRKEIEEIRQCVFRDDNEGAGKIKKWLPAVSLSGYVTEGRRAKACREGRFRHSGFLQGDFDEKEFYPRSADEVKETLVSDPHVQAAFSARKAG